MEKEFINIIKQHQGIILKICRMYSNESSGAEDLFQEIVLQLWHSYPRFNKASKVTTWMYRIGLNTAITSLRRHSKRPDKYPTITDYENYAEKETERMDIQYHEELQAAIESLNRFDKALLMLYLDEKTYKEMAEIMELSESNIGVKISRIKQKLKSILNPPAHGT